MNNTGIITLVSDNGIDPVVTLSKETYVTSKINRENNKLTVILHHRVNNTPFYRDHKYTVNLEMNVKQYNIFCHWSPCPIHENAIDTDR